MRADEIDDPVKVQPVAADRERQRPGRRDPGGRFVTAVVLAVETAAVDRLSLVGPDDNSELRLPAVPNPASPFVDPDECYRPSALLAAFQLPGYRD